MGLSAVFEDENSLPGSEGHAAVVDGDDFRRTGEHHADMAWHVVGAFEGVDEIGIVLADQAVEPSFQIASRAGVGVFHEDQACAGMAEQDGDLSGFDFRIGDDACDFIGNFIGAFAPGANAEFGGVDLHDLFL